ncbi:hypothetical protein DICPUDRAFT_93580 [Dictyostelium purpureum]|uniref:Methyltransferase type 11 domain-containing protein n=1 Tax=Dictyostelium purpureum TaxID=5786 RepID=F0Z993_DICPU|nr:uncharacterized protein DICPUDRAFT_93580 [Dictyostelium purpureum]EGC39513.1 hypothetical protein DICPUDRAFT_93580 [Dictyostelium purpureum]|eukprot:XP_003283960.1 hypothetical protein DICPUDRAFT_93580 [Dictyostelium purpureum]
MNKPINSQVSKGWDSTAEVFAKYISPANISTGFSTLFAIDALNATIEDPNKEMTILDIGSGTGGLSLYGTSKYKNARFISTDFSPKMIQILDTFIKELNIQTIESKVMDGQNLEPIKDSSIDYTYSIFALIFFPDIVKGMKEMYRVLKPGGKTAIGSWCLDSFLIKVFQQTMDELLGNNSFKQVALSLSDKQVFEDKLKEVGFVNIEIKRVQHPMEIQETTDLIKMFSVNPVYFDCLEALPDDKKPLLDQTIINVSNRLLEGHKRNQNGKLELPSFAYIGIGQKN